MTEQRSVEAATGPQAEIVVGVDGSPASTAAVDYAIEIARQTGRPLHLVHATPLLGPFPPLAIRAGDEIFESGRSLLARVAAHAKLAAPGLDIRDTLAFAPRKSELVSVARDAALLVLGRRDDPDPHRLATGSTAATLAAIVPCPVRVVPQDWRTRNHDDDVVVGVKNLDGSDPLVTRGLELAATTGGTLVLAHAWYLPSGYQGILTPDEIAERNAHAAAQLEHSVSGLRQAWPQVPVRATVQTGRPDQVLGALAERATLVVVGRPEHAHVFSHLGRTARALLQSSAAPVEVGPRVASPGRDDLVAVELERDGAMLR